MRKIPMRTIPLFVACSLASAGIGGVATQALASEHATFDEKLPALLPLGLNQTLNKKTGFSGDTFVLTVEMQSDAFAELALRIPRYEKLYSVALQKNPLSYQDGTYKQTIQWIFQSMEPGELEIVGIQAIITQGSESQTYPLPSFTLNIQSYGTADTSNSLATLPSEPGTPQSKGPSWVFGLICVTGFIFIANFLTHRLRKPAPTQAKPTSSGERLLQASQLDPIPQTLLVEILEDPETELSNTLRHSIEQAAYANSYDDDTLRALIEKELQK